ncbi:MAG: hypothetical protein Ct9H300mP1_20330 [Planctomycetaceae bacterium]|nr:MAG: hypothetical protein Ct9H300mP1_20330 [Planctomycetaceae bacterium]
MYTNQVSPYHRAPHILVGFPMRYVERGWSPSMRALPERAHREMRAESHIRYGTGLTEAQVMASRDGVHFKRWNDPFIPPGPERPDTWNYSHLGMATQPVETASDLPGADRELSVYGKGGRLDRNQWFIQAIHAAAGWVRLDRCTNGRRGKC